MTQDEMRELLTGKTGSPSELAAEVGAKPSDSTFRRVLASLVTAGELVPTGSTRDRRYRLPTARELAGLTTEDGYTDSEKFGPLSAQAAKGGRIIGSGKPPQGST